MWVFVQDSSGLFSLTNFVFLTVLPLAAVVSVRRIASSVSFWILRLPVSRMIVKSYGL